MPSIDPPRLLRPFKIMTSHPQIPYGVDNVITRYHIGHDKGGGKTKLRGDYCCQLGTIYRHALIIKLWWKVFGWLRRGRCRLVEAMEAQWREANEGFKL